MDYHHKYIKYKTKYINLKNQLKQIHGGKYLTKYLTKPQRKKELENVKNTKSYLPFNKLTTRDKIYNIEDNGDVPFQVIANKEGLTINKRIATNDGKKIYETIIKIKKFEGYWFGFDTTPYKRHGNSILIKIDIHKGKNKYIFVGWEIYSFVTNEEILDYMSPMGNNSVPYPLAYSQNNVYFMLDKKTIKMKDLETPVTVANADDIYGEFYGYVGTKGNIHPKYNLEHVKILQHRLV